MTESPYKEVIKEELNYILESGFYLEDEYKEYISEMNEERLNKLKEKVITYAYACDETFHSVTDNVIWFIEDVIDDKEV